MTSTKTPEHKELDRLVTHNKLSYDLADNKWATTLAAIILGGDPNGGKYAWPLLRASECGNVLVVKALLKLGASVNQTDDNGLTALWYACGSNKSAADIVPILLSAGADPNPRCRDDTPPLHIAAQSSTPETVALLISHGADPYRRDKRHLTPLDYAKQRRDSAIVSLLEAAMTGHSQSAGQ